MQKSSINPAILQQVLDSSPNAADKGQSQFFTPLDFGQRVATALPKFRGTIVDLNCGATHLLRACANESTSHLLASDIDPCRSIAEPNPAAQVLRLTQDLTLLYPKLKEIQFKADLFVLNPPWGLEWHTDRLADLADSDLLAVRQAYAAAGKTIDSTVATLLIALDRCSSIGEGLIIANDATLRRLIFDQGAPFAAVAQHCWCRLIIEGNPMTGIKDCNWQHDQVFYTGVLYFARGHTTGPRTQVIAESDQVASNGWWDLRVWRQVAQAYQHLATDSVTPWRIVKEHLSELASAAIKPRYHLWLSNGIIQTQLSRFEERSVKVDKQKAAELHRLKGKTPMQLVIQRNDREELVHAARESGWSVQPLLLTAIDEAIREYQAQRAPLYPLNKIKRLGYLDEENKIDCEADLRLGKSLVFRKGVTYPLRTRTVDVERKAEKPNSVSGEIEEHHYTGQELAIFIKAEEGEYAFLDGALRAEGITLHLDKKGRAGDQIDFTLAELADHFHIPEVPDVALVHPDAYARAIATLNELETLLQIKLKSFQKVDLARGSLHAGLILGWDTGLGKTWTLFIFPFLKLGFKQIANAEGRVSNSSFAIRRSQLEPNGTVLVVAPGDLHEQICNEARDCFAVKVNRLDSQATFTQLCRTVSGSVMPRLTADGRPMIPPGFYITSYTQLTTNGVNALPDVDKWDPRALLDWLCLKMGDAAAPVATDFESSGWPDTVVDFFVLRGRKRLWQTQYDVFKLEWQYATLRDLDLAMAREVDALDGWEDAKAAANRRQFLGTTHALLQHLVPDCRPGRNRVTFVQLTADQHDWIIREFCRRKLEDYAQGCGETRSYPIGSVPDGYIADKTETDTRLKWRIKCTAYPSLSDLSYNAFDCVSIDEAVRLKGETTAVGLGVRFLDPIYRVLATATPIKNRLPDIFRLAWWAAGGRPEAHARFPYRDDSSELAQFTKTFLVTDHITAFEKNGKPKPSRQKVTAQVCNIHRLWKLLGPLVMRRRKQDCGEEIVPRLKQIIRCKMGTEQRRVYNYHIQAAYIDCNGQKAIGAQLQALRQAAVGPATKNLVSQPGTPTEPCPRCSTQHTTRKTKCSLCNGRRLIDLPFRATTDYIPKTAAVLTLIRDILARNEQVILFSAFNDPNYHLATRLHEAGVRHLVLDGNSNQKKRGAAAAIFKSGRNYYTDPAGGIHQPIPVTLAGVDSMAEGHSFHRCVNVILYCYSWAMDKFKQALDRVHRLNSVGPINVYVVFCDGTIDARLESLTDEKTDSADLVLDGALLGDTAEEVNFAELLQIARDEFAGEQRDTVDENDLLAEWPALCQSLRGAQFTWDNTLPPHPQTVRPNSYYLPTPAPVPPPSSLLSVAWLDRSRERSARFAQLNLINT